MHFAEKKIPRLQKLKPTTKAKHSPERPGMITPPLHTSATIPFGWEEKPGKPRRSCTSLVSFSNCTPNKSLELPPRLLFSHANRTKLPSTTTVLSKDLSASFSTAEREQLGNMVKDFKVKKHVFQSCVVGKGNQDHVGSTIRGYSHHKNKNVIRIKKVKSLVWRKICYGWKRVVPVAWKSEKLKKYHCWLP